VERNFRPSEDYRRRLGRRLHLCRSGRSSISGSLLRGDIFSHPSLGAPCDGEGRFRQPSPLGQSRPRLSHSSPCMAACGQVPRFDSWAGYRTARTTDRNRPHLCEYAAVGPAGSTLTISSHIRRPMPGDASRFAITRRGSTRADEDTVCLLSIDATSNSAHGSAEDPLTFANTRRVSPADLVRTRLSCVAFSRVGASSERLQQVNTTGGGGLRVEALIALRFAG